MTPPTTPPRSRDALREALQTIAGLGTDSPAAMNDPEGFAESQLRIAIGTAAHALAGPAPAWSESDYDSTILNGYAAEPLPALAAPAPTLPEEIRSAWRVDHDMVLVRSIGDQEPQSLEIPAWVVRAIYAQAGKDPHIEAERVSRFIDEHMALDVERLWHVLEGWGVIANGTWVSFQREDAERLATAYEGDGA